MFSRVKKMALKLWNPNENPNDVEKEAFALLDSGNVDGFMKHVCEHEVNLNIVDFNKASLLIKAQDVANDTSVLKKKLSEEERKRRAAIAVQFLLSTGATIDYQDKNGLTALLSAVHWGNNEIATLLLKNGANPNLGSNTNNFFMNPLQSACFKDNYPMIATLLAYGADVEYALKLDTMTKGFKLTEEQREVLRKVARIANIAVQRKEDIKDGKITALSRLSDVFFYELCSYVE